MDPGNEGDRPRECRERLPTLWMQFRLQNVLCFAFYCKNVHLFAEKAANMTSLKLWLWTASLWGLLSGSLSSKFTCTTPYYYQINSVCTFGPLPCSWILSEYRYASPVEWNTLHKICFRALPHDSQLSLCVRLAMRLYVHVAPYLYYKNLLGWAFCSDCTNFPDRLQILYRSFASASKVGHVWIHTRLKHLPMGRQTRLEITVFVWKSDVK